MESDHVKNRDAERKGVTLEVVKLWPLPTQIYVSCDLPKFSGRNNIAICKNIKQKERKTCIH
jgi:hypothetical protein